VADTHGSIRVVEKTILIFAFIDGLSHESHAMRMDNIFFHRGRHIQGSSTSLNATSPCLRFWKEEVVMIYIFCFF
jgi:hypothetical protein